MIASELIPIHLSRWNLRITVTLPFLAALSATAGPLTAIAIDFLAVSIAAIGFWLVQRHRIHTSQFFLNALVSATSAGVAGLVQVAASGGAGGSIMSEVTVFGAIYSLTNILLVAVAQGESWRDVRGLVTRDAVSMVAAVGLLLLLGLGVAAAIETGANFLLPFMLIPVLMLRAAMDLKARSIDHTFETVIALMLMLQRAHPYSHGHLERVASLAEKVALKLGLSARRAHQVREAAILHDIGKIAIDEQVLEKPGKLTEEEFEHVKKHAEYGALILGECDHFLPLVPWIRSHHERPDGGGYPQRLPDAEIPIESKIIAVTDAFDAMVGGGMPGEKRSYRDPMDLQGALAELDRCAGTQFDRRVVIAFRDVLLGGEA